MTPETSTLLDLLVLVILPTLNTPDNSTKFNELRLICAICEGDDHVATMGPRQKKLIQYFTCKRFVEMSCAERLSELMKKHLCIQCLFPGADFKTGKHKDGKCQRDFACQHPSHNNYNVKKHVLVCDEHKDTDENKKLLEEYKRRFILKE